MFLSIYKYDIWFSFGKPYDMFAEGEREITPRRGISCRRYIARSAYITDPQGFISQNKPPLFAAAYFTYLDFFSQAWLATPQEVLQADWQEVWHSPHPPFLTEARRSRVLIVRILFIIKIHLSIIKYALYSINDFCAFVKRF